MCCGFGSQILRASVKWDSCWRDSIPSLVAKIFGPFQGGGPHEGFFGRSVLEVAPNAIRSNQDHVNHALYLSFLLLVV